MMRQLLLIASLISSSVLAEVEVTTDLMAKALEGDKEARLTIARVMGNPSHGLYHPDKSVEVYIKLARDGHQEAFSPLAEAFSNPDSDFYDPARAITYLRKVPGVSPGRVLLTETLSYRQPISRLKGEMEVRDIKPSDPYYPILEAFTYFPFNSETSEQRRKLISAAETELAAPFLAYIYPALVLPIAGQTHLFRVAEAALGGKALPAMSWYEDTFTKRWYPVTDTQGVEWVSFALEPDEWRGQRLAGIVVSYPAEALSALQEYYSSMMTPYEDGLSLPGVFLRFTESGDSAYAEFIFTAVQPLLKPSRVPDDPAKKKAIPRMLFTSTIPSK